MPEDRQLVVFRGVSGFWRMEFAGILRPLSGGRPPAEFPHAHSAEVAVKKISLLLAVLGLSVAGSALAAQSTKDVSKYPLGERGVYTERATIERITPVGKVCVEGKECAGVQAAAAAPVPGAAPRSGEQVFNASCQGCHATGAAGAPKVGDKAAWAPHIAKGKDTLYKHALTGFNAMPPKGMCMNCSDDEIKATVDYMISKSK
jgi:cytochrome c5